ncbi:MAG: hypothetical protein KAR56_00565 [Thermoplasmata archaeon]|nr:hypothetical protein [Thermoplasmata archaeon]
MDEKLSEPGGKTSSLIASDLEQPKQAGNSEDMIDRDFMVKAKIGDGLCLASLILGIIVTIIMPSMTVGNYDVYDASRVILLVAVPMSVGAIATGLLGTRFQRMVNYKFGFGIAGAVLGFIMLLMLMIYALMFTFLGEIQW